LSSVASSLPLFASFVFGRVTWRFRARQILSLTVLQPPCLPPWMLTRAGGRAQAVKMAPQGEAETDREAAKAMGHEHHGSGLHIRERIKGLFGGGSSAKKEQ